MAELMRLYYPRYPPEGLQAGSGGIGYHALKIMFSIPVLGVIAIRIIEIFTVSQSIFLTVCLVVISMMPGVILPAVAYVCHRARNLANRSEIEEVNVMEPTSLPEQTRLHESRFISAQTRLRSIFDTMGFIVGNNAVLVLFLESVCIVVPLVVTPVVVFLEWIVYIAYRQFRNRGRPERRADDTGPEEMPV